MNGSGRIEARAIAIAAIMAAVVCSRGLAVDTTWKHDPATAGAWGDAGNWTGGLPTASVRGFIDNGGTALITTDFSAYGGQAYVGSTGAGSVIQSSGVFSGFNLYIGNSVGGTGSYQLNGGTLSGTVLVGQQGTGLFVQTGSSTATMGVRLGGYATGSGHYLLQSGTLNIASGAVDLDIEANGLFEQTGGSYTGSYVDLGYGTGAVGATFRVTGGTQNIQGRVEVGANQQATVESLFQVGGTANLQASEVQVGLYGPGRYLQTGGQSNIGLLQVSRSANNSIADLQGGSLSAGTVLLGDQHYPTSVGVYRQSGGSLQVGAFSMSQGSRIEFANGQIATTRGLVCTGTFDFTAPGGTLDLAAGSSLDLSKASILHPGNGRINAQANTLVLLPAGFNLASLAGYASAGVTHLAGTTLEIPASQALTAMGNIDGYVKCLGSLKVGKSTDSLSVTKGVEVPAGGAMDMGAGSAVVETTTGGVSGGSLAGSGLTIGSAGTGRFTQSDGTTTMQYGIVLGEKAGSDGRLDLSGGAMTATAIFVGKAGNGHVVQTGGTLTGTANSSSYSDYSLVVAAPAGVTALYELGGSGSLNLYNATIGDYRGFGLFQQTGGAVTVNSHLGVGYGSGNGRYEMSGGTMNAGYLSVGEPQGTATSSRFVQTGGSITSSALTLYRGGSYLMSGTSGVHVTGDTEVDGQSTPVFRQEGGACQIDGNLNLGEWYGGRYEMAGGTLATGHTLVNKATFQQAAGSHTVGVLEVTALGRYELGADTLTVTGSWANAGQMDFLSAAGRVVVADNGFVDFRGGSILNCANASMSLGTNSYMLAPVGFDPQVAFHSFQTGGIVHVAGTTMSVPDGYNLTFSGSLDDLVDCRGKLSSEPGKALNLTNGLKLRTSGVVNLENGTLTVTGSTSTTSGQLKAAYIHVGPNPTAKLTQTIGSVQATWNVQVGAGAYVMNGTGTLDASQLVLGGEGDGYFTQNNGYLTVEGGAILIGDAAGSGTYQLVNGSSSSYGVYIGGCPDFYGKPQKGDGHWVQSGGTATTNYVTVRGVVHDATVDVSGGTMMARNMIASGINGTWGVFRQTGGVVSAADSDYYQGMTLGDVTGEQGRYELSGTGLLHASNLFVGLEGTGAFQQTGGAVTVSDKLGIGFWYSAQGDYRMDGGTLTVQGNEYLGFMGAGRFVQRGGTHTTPQTFMGYYTGNGGPVFGSYDLQGGQFQPGSLNVGYTGTGMFTQSGGSNSTGSLTLGNQAGAHGEYRLSGGTLTVTGGLIVGNGGTGTFGVTGPGPTISTGSYAQAATGTLVSEVTATGLAPITVNGQAALNGAWTVLDDAAPFGTFSVLFAKGGISGTFSAISLPGQNWHWGVTGGKTLWVSHDVPEPATALLLAGGALATLRRRARRGPAENAIAGEPRGG